MGGTLPRVQGLPLIKPPYGRIAAYGSYGPVVRRAPADGARVVDLGDVAIMPGLVNAISVREGQEVKAGEPLAIVEAMKMENVLRAEHDGRVARIRVTPGDSLTVDQVILEFE